MKQPIRKLLFVPAEPDQEQFEARRCGLFPDLFADQHGRIYQVKEIKPTPHNGSLVFRYDRTNLSALHAIADAWLPNWEESGSQVVPADGNRRNLRPENLIIAGEAGRGRPRNNAAWRRLKARQLYIYCTTHPSDLSPEEAIEAVAEELEISKRDVRAAVLDLLES